MSKEKIKVWPIPEIADQPIPGVYEPPKKKFDFRNDKPDNEYEPSTISEMPFPRSITAYQLVSMSLDTQSRRILMQYTFGQSGAIQIGNYKNGTSGDVRISPNGIVGRNSAGQTTFAINGTTGDASFLGTITSTAGNIGGWSITASELSNGNVKIQSSAERILFGSAIAPLIGIGIFLGKDGADYEFRAGNPSGNYIHWDGVNLNIKGNILTGSIVAGYIQVGGAAGDVNGGGTTIDGGKITANTITGTQISASTKITAGSGNNVGVLDGSDATYRIYAGNATPAFAPFRVSQAGILTATGATITGTINATAGTFTGDVTTTAGIRAGTGNDIVQLNGVNQSLEAYQSGALRVRIDKNGVGFYNLSGVLMGTLYGITSGSNFIQSNVNFNVQGDLTIDTLGKKLYWGGQPALMIDLNTSNLQCLKHFVPDLDNNSSRILGSSGQRWYDIRTVRINGNIPLSGIKIYYVSDTLGGAATRKLTFTDGILTSEI